jgi:signal transduction histidine kinase
VLVSSYFVNKHGKGTVIVAAQDVTERKKTEEALKTTNQELETFIYRASHDLRGPLASIIGLANLSKLEIKDTLALKYLDMIGTGTEKLDYTLTELVKAMEIKNIENFSNVIDFESMIKEAIVKFEFFPGYSRLKIDIEISLEKIFTSNRFILETIIQNLVENAIKYQNYNCPEPFLKIKVSENEDGVDIVVQDNGLGIQKSIQKRIFEMYFRGASDLKGSGLGLYLVKKGVEKLNGIINLDSEKGEGAIFTIKLQSKYPVFLN